MERGLSRSAQRKRDGKEEESGCRKKGRKLNFEVLSDTWGEEDVSKDNQVKNKDGLMRSKEKKGSIKHIRNLERGE